MLTRRELGRAVAGAFALASSPKGAEAAWAQFTAASGGGGPAQGWSELKVGPGGLVKACQIADDGYAVCCCDTFGAYGGKLSTMVGVGGTTKWSLLSNTNAIPGSFATYANAVFYTNTSKPNGVWDIGVAPGNSQVLGMMAGGYVFISTNQGSTWLQASGVTQDTTEFSNGNFVSAFSVAFDPANEAICYIGHSQQGVWKSTTATNGSGGTWSQISTGTLPISSVKANSCGQVIIKFDRSGGTLSTPTRTKNIYVFINGSGVYKSTDGGSTWALTSSGPTTLVGMDVGRDGYVYGINAGTTTYIYNGTAWSTQTANVSGNGPAAIAADPNTNGRLTIVSFDGSQSTSANHGVSWTSVVGIASGWLTATDVPWLHDVSTLTSGGIGFSDTVFALYDPSQSNVLVQPMGVGVMVNSPTTGAPTFTSVGQGIEQLVCNDMICPPSGNPIVASWDRPFITTNGFGATTFSSSYFPHAPDAGISSGSQGINLDWASDGSGTIIASGPQSGASSASGGPGFVSTNKGSTWAGMATQPFTVYGGNVACASSTTWLMLDPTSGKLWITVNSGSSWAQATGAPTTGWPTTAQPFGQYSQCICADRVTANKFYAYNSAGIYSGTVSGSALAFTNVGSAPQTTNGYSYYFKFKSVPGQAGHLIAAASNQSSGAAISRSRDGGVTWSNPNASALACSAFDFGATKSGASYPSLWTWQKVGSTYGLYESNDEGDTYTHVVDATWGNWPAGDLDVILALCASKDTYGYVAVGFQGSGYQQGYFPV